MRERMVWEIQFVINVLMLVGYYGIEIERNIQPILKK